MKKTSKARPMFVRYLEGARVREARGGYNSRPGDTCILPPEQCPNSCPQELEPNSSTLEGDYDY